jgi:adenylate kinase family enzyme
MVEVFRPVLGRDLCHDQIRCLEARKQKRTAGWTQHLLRLAHEVDAHRNRRAPQAACGKTPVVQRVAIVSGPGAGKTSLSRALALPHLELDALWWESGWQQAPLDVFQERVREAADRDEWVIDGFYIEEAGVPIVWPRADTLVWLDLPRRRCVPRAVRRSLGQVVRRVELWNGNRQPISVLTPRSVWRLWRRWPTYPATIERALAAHDWSHLEVVRLSSDHEVRQFLVDRSDTAGPRKPA